MADYASHILINQRQTEKTLHTVTLDANPQEFSASARRIAALLLLEPELDANYRAVTADVYAWPTSQAAVLGAQ